MLQFLKKGTRTGHQKYSNTPPSQRSKLETSFLHENPIEIRKTISLPLDDEGLFDIGEIDSSKEHSRLTRTLSDVISDKCALRYFIQFMESRNASSYILCWLDIESIKSICEHNHSNFKLSPNSPVPHSQVDHDSLSVSTDCDSYTADSNSLYDYSPTSIPEGKLTQDSTCDKNRGDNSVKFRICSDDSCSEKRNVQNIVDRALVIFKQYIALEAQCNIKCLEEVRKEVMENICNSEKVLSPNCFDSVQNFVYNTIQDEYFTAFLESDYFCKYQIDLLTSGNVVLDDILYNETALFYFMEYLEQENHRNLLEFWMAASNFQQQLHDQKEFFDPVEAQTDAVVLYDKYFSLQALCPLGFSDKVRFAVEQSICGEHGLMPDCFHLPLKIVERVLERNYFKSFLASQLYYKYLSDLINTVQSNSYSNIEKYKNVASDCSSEKSFSQSTFLAFEIPHDIKTSKKSTDMTIDTRKLYDPDSLWKRKKCHRLSIAHIDQLGKYETHFEPEPDRKQFKLKNMLRKVVSLDDEDKKKEEMAWQVAEMIVKDITNITLGNQDE